MANNRAARAAGVSMLFAVLATSTLTADEIPHFARMYGVDCSTCHASPPKLNAFGESFRQAGYSASELEGRARIPLAVWASGRSDYFPDEPAVSDAVRGYINKLELISAGDAGLPWLSYFVEWRAVSLETQRRDGEVRLRDRSGRFEDLFVSAALRNLALTVGQFRQIEQVDVSLRLGLSEPLSLSASLPGGGAGSGREISLRGYSPAGRSPAVRTTWRQPIRAGWSWTTSVGLPIPGELSIPLTREARTEASNEIEWRLKGVSLESYIGRGLQTLGAHAFYDPGDRLLVQAVTTGSRARFFWTGVLGMDRQDGVTRGRWSAEGEYIARRILAVGGRVEDRAGDGVPRVILPYARAHFPGTRYTVYLGVEQRVQRDRNATLIEIGTVF